MKKNRMDTLNAEREKALREINKKKNRLKNLEKEIAAEKRRERTKRLCTRAGMLESFLIEPELLTNDDVYDLLTFVFSFGGVQRELNAKLQKRRQALAESADDGPVTASDKPESDGAENVPFPSLTE